MARKLEVLIVGDSSSLSRAFRDATGNASAFGNTLARVGRIATVALGTGVAAGLTVSVKAAVDFERQMRNVNSIAKLGEKDFTDLGKSVTGMAGEVGQAPKVLAEGLYDIVSSGFKASSAVKILRVSAKAATAGMTDTATATKAVVASLNAYHLGADKARAVSDILFQTVNKGVLTFDELSQNIGDVLPSASALQVPLTELGGALATITLHGVNAAEASTQVKQVMISMLKPSVGLKAEFKSLGYESAQSALKQKGLVGVIEDLSKAAHGNQKTIAEWFPNVRALSGFMGLAGKNIKLFRENVEAMDEATKGAGVTSKVFAEQSKSLAVQWKKTSAALDVFKIEIGNALLPALKTALFAVNHFFGELNKAQGFRAKLNVVWEGLGEAAHRIVDAIRSAMDTVDWSSVGNAIVAGIRRGLSQAAGIAAQLNAILQQTLNQVNWEQVGTTIGPLVAAAVVAGLATILDPAFWVRHWQEMAAIALAVFPASKLAGIGGKLVGALVRPVAETLGPLLRVAMTKAGDLVLSIAARLPRRIGPIFLDAVLAAARFFARLPGAIGAIASRLGAYVAGKLGSFKSFVIKALAIDAIIHAVVQQISNLVNKIEDAFKRLWAWLRGVAPGIARSAGFAIGNALTAGVVSGVAGLAGRITGVVQGALSHLPHISIPGFSPISHVGERIGSDLGHGVILGFLNGTNDLPAKVGAKIKAALEAGKKIVEGYRGVFEGVFGRMLDLALRAFDAKTQAKIDKFQAQAQALTPAEQQIAGIESGRAAEDRARAISDAQQRLADAQAGGDQQAIVDAQRDLNRALQDEQIFGLQQQAAVERAAQEAQVAEQQKNYEFQREQQRLHLEAQVAALEKGLENGHLTQKQFHAKLMKLLAANGVDMASAGEMLGTAFAAGLARSIAKVVAAANKLANAIKRILKLRSPAEEGPLSDLDTWWTPLGDMLASQIDESKVRAAAQGLAGAMSGSYGGQPVFAGGSGGGVIDNHIHVYLDGKQIMTSVQRQGANYSSRNAATPF